MAPAGVQVRQTRAPQPLLEPLTDRELEVLGLMAVGASNQEIADQLFVALTTVKKHARNIFGKLGASNRVQAITRAKERAGSRALSIVALELCDVTKLYQPTSNAPLVALNHISLSVPKGQVTGVVGPCGTGKRTLLRLAAGRAPLSSGTIRRCGPVSLIPWRLSWHESVREVLRRAFLRQNSREPGAHAARVLAECGLNDMAETPAALLDRESQWWLQLGVALAGERSVLLADHPPAEALTERLGQWAAS